MKKIFALSIFFLLLTSVAFTGTVNLPRTGQTKCYDTAGIAIPCAGTGQDGEIQAGVAWPNPRFTVNADTTMTDNLTGLVWAPDGNIMPTRDPGWDTDYTPGYGTPNDGRVTWQHALDYVAKLNAENYLNYNDWRLPNVNELESLVIADESSNVASWLNNMGFTNVQADYYLSSTSLADNKDFVWLVYLVYGSVGHGQKSYSSGFYVWPVRGGDTISAPAQIWQTGQTVSYALGDDGDLEKGIAWPTPRFTDHGDTVTDNLTGLMWTKNSNLPGDYLTWQQALDYVKGMNAGTYENFGYTDWRLPNRKELHSLTDFSRYGPALSVGHPFTNVQTGIYSMYWSSTTNAQSYYKYFAWVFMMYYGHVDYDGKSYNTYYDYVWPVRGGQVGSQECSTWADVIAKYQAYVSSQASWNDVITCYNQYASP